MAGVTVLFIFLNDTYEPNDQMLAPGNRNNGDGYQ